MTKTPVSKLILTLGLPTTVSMLITGIYNLADTYFVGALGESPQAATGILFTLQSIIQAIAFMLGHGSGGFVSKALADKDTDEATTYVSSAFFVGGAAGTLLTVLGLIFLEPFMLLLGSTKTILPYACDYGFWVLASCPFMVCSLVLNNNLRYEGKAFYAMIGLTTGGVLNIFGDWLLVGKLGLGVWGAGLSTAVSQSVSFVILLVLYLKMAQSTISIRAVSRKIAVYWGIVKVGFPSLIRQGLTSISSGLLNNLTKPFGDAAIAAMSVVNRFSMLVMCVGLGIGQGFQPVASFNYQAREYKRVKQGLIFTMVFGFCAVAVLSIFGFLLAEPIVLLFQKSDEVVKVGVPALRFATVGLLFLPLSVPVNMLYQSIRRAGVASFLSILRSGAVLIPTLLIAVPLFDLTGIQIAQPFSDCITGLISIPFTIYFLRQDHERINAAKAASSSEERRSRYVVRNVQRGNPGH
ncbi:MAG: MATE family efflux transporter [Clostridia bacterium]|nr:MATE family efflux transporter [Clostridia bacterium]